MPFSISKPDWPSLRIYIESVAIALVGGATFNHLGVPAGWLSGAITSVALASLGGRTMAAPEALRWPVFILLGSQIGSAVTREAVGLMVTWPLSLLMMSLCVIAIQISSQLFLEHICGWRRDTAFYASVPGSMTYAIALAATTHSDMRQVVLNQSLRIVLLVLILPNVIVHFEGRTGGSLPILPHEPRELVILLAGAIVGGAIGTRLRIPAGALMGAMAVSATLHGTGTIVSGWPNWVLVPCFLYIGCMAGSRFNGTGLRLLASILGGALGSFVVVICVAGLFALANSWLTGLPLSSVALAFSPGGLEAMALMAFILNLDAAYVGVHHVIRLVTISASVPFLARSHLGGGHLGPPDRDDERS